MIQGAIGAKISLKSTESVANHPTTVCFLLSLVTLLGLLLQVGHDLLKKSAWYLILVSVERRIYAGGEGFCGSVAVEKGSELCG